MKTYDGCCGSCESMNTNDYVRTKDHCYCTIRKQYYDLTEPKCRYYKYDKYKDYYDLNHRWYIVGVIFNKLGLSDNYECINMLHNFRKDILEKDNKYFEILAKYDLVGPDIAKKLMEDENSEELCKKLLQTYLVRVLDNIRDEKYDEALELYIEMVSLLKIFYNINVSQNNKTKKLSLDK